MRRAITLSSCEAFGLSVLFDLVMQAGGVPMVSTTVFSKAMNENIAMTYLMEL